jgi:hypothetical protein
VPVLAEPRAPVDRAQMVRERIYAALEERGSLLRTDMFALFCGRLTVDELVAALAQLEYRGLVRREPPKPNGLRGRPGERWHLVSKEEGNDGP